ncbi:MAG: sugar ABC transporter ATP-binding protein [Nitrososphaeria archaeon]
MFKIDVKNVSKNFGNIKALQNISLSLENGKIYGLVGLNGAGKSTFLKVLTGMVYPDSGDIFINNKKVKIESPKKALEYGINMAYQELSLISELSVLDNIYLGKEITKAGFIDGKKMEEMIKWAKDFFNLTFDLNEKIKNLGLQERQIVEIIKSYSLPNLQAWLLDEPTAYLSEDYVKKLFDLIRRTRSQNKMIIFVSHRMDEILQISDVIIIFRDGKVVDVVESSNTNVDQIVKEMTGEQVVFTMGKKSFIKRDKPILEIDDLSIPNTKISNITFKVYAGEVLCLAGLASQGASEIIKAIYGILPCKGKIKIEEREIKLNRIKDSIKEGIVYISGDKVKEGLFPTRSITENLMAAKYSILKALKLLKRSEENIEVKKLAENLKILYGSLDEPVVSLSGGTQQKVIIARGLSVSPKIILFNDPLSGVDVPTKESFYQMIDQIKKDRGVIFYSSDINEILKVCDRIFVIFNGKLFKEYKDQIVTYEDLVKSYYGVA